MRFPSRATQAIWALYEKNLDLARSRDDNDRRRLTRIMAEQISALYGDRWGCKKRAGLGDEWQGKDAIAYKEDDGTTSVWDWQSGTTREPQIRTDSEPNHPHLSTREATFMPVTPTDHLQWVVPVPPDPPPDPPGLTLEQRVFRLEQLVGHFFEALEDYHDV